MRRRSAVAAAVEPSAICSAIGALSGANGAACGIQQRYTTPDQGEADIRERVSREEIVVGLEHPVYTSADPRSTVIKEVARRLSVGAGDARTFDIADRLKLVMRKIRDVPTYRDHCQQYMVAVSLIFGELTAAPHEEAAAKDPRIDALRAKMRVAENRRHSKEYHDPDKPSIDNCIQVFHPRLLQRRDEHREDRDRVPDRPSSPSHGGHPAARAEVPHRSTDALPAAPARRIYELCLDAERLQTTSANGSTDLFAI